MPWASHTEGVEEVADREDARFGWIDHGRELVDVEHTQVRHGKRRAGVLGRLV